MDKSLWNIAVFSFLVFFISLIIKGFLLSVENNCLILHQNKIQWTEHIPQDFFMVIAFYKLSHFND